LFFKLISFPSRVEGGEAPSRLGPTKPSFVKHCASETYLLFGLLGSRCSPAAELSQEQHSFVRTTSVASMCVRLWLLTYW